MTIAHRFMYEIHEPSALRKTVQKIQLLQWQFKSTRLNFKKQNPVRFQVPTDNKLVGQNLY